jgi:hydrogenase maturation protease
VRETVTATSAAMAPTAATASTTPTASTAAKAPSAVLGSATIATRRATIPKPRLVLGLGNPLMGDDGIGWHVVEALRSDARLPADVEVCWGGTDLLGCARLLRDRRCVVLVDAMAGDGEGSQVGEVVVLEPWPDGLQDSAGETGETAGAHTLSVTAALDLLRSVEPAFAGLDLRVLGVQVDGVAAGERLSPRLDRCLLAIAERVLATLGAPVPPLA